MTATAIGRAALNRVTRERFRRHFRPLPRLTLSQWAPKYRVLSPEATAQHGPWQNEVVPYLAEIMDAVSDRSTQEITVVSPSQAAKTELILNTIGYFVHQEPSPILVVQPTVETGESFSKDRVAPMIRDCAALSTLIAPARSRESNNTILSKALALDTPIPTPNGWTTMGGINPGDMVFNELGQTTEVTAVSPVFENHACYLVSFSDGTSIVADGGHLWPVEWWQVEAKNGTKAKNTRKAGVLTTEAMAPRVMQGVRHRYSIRNAAPLNVPYASLPIDPYVLGVWLGDGNSNSTRITSHVDDVDEMAMHVRACGHDVVKRLNRDDTFSFIIDPQSATANIGGTGQFTKTTVGLRAELRNLDLIRKQATGPSKKHIPPAYLRASVAQRIALLQGLMDTDGSITKNGRSANFVSVIPAVYTAFGELLNSLGIKHRGTLRENYATIGGVRIRGKDGMQFEFAPPDFDLFRLERKLARQRSRRTIPIRVLYRRITAITPVESVPTRCITVASDSHLFLAGQSMIPTHNSYPGGQLDITGANAPSGLAMRPKRIVLLDERDRHPRSAGTEGDVKAIARARTRSFQRRRKIVEVSSPTSLEESLIWPSYLEGTQEVYEVPCPHCQAFQTLQFVRLKWVLDEAGKVDAESVAYECAACEQRIPARDKGAMLRAGRWRATVVARVPHKRSFHITGLVAAFALWEEIAQEFVTAHGQTDAALRAEMLRAFFNTTLGELYVDTASETQKTQLKARALPYAVDGSFQVPREAGILTAGVDVQHDRLEIVVRAFGVGAESWLIERAILRADTSQQGVWLQLDEYRTRRTWTHENGAPMKIRAMTVDASDGARSKEVYTYCAPRLSEGVFAIKGHGSPSAPMLPLKPTKVKPGRLYVIGVHAIMETMYRRLAMTEKGPGFLHVNEFASETPPHGVPADYIDQWLSMHRERDEKTRRYRWVASKNQRNEVADCETYAYAALLLGPVPLTLLANEVTAVNAAGDRLRSPAPEPTSVAPVAARPTPWMPPRRGGWMRR